MATRRSSSGSGSRESGGERVTIPPGIPPSQDAAASGGAPDARRGSRRRPAQAALAPGAGDAAAGSDSGRQADSGLMTDSASGDDPKLARGDSGLTADSGSSPSSSPDSLAAGGRATDSLWLSDGRSTLVAPEVRHRMIAEAAYHRAANRGFGPGAEVDDWLAAERDVDAFLAAGEGAPPV